MADQPRSPAQKRNDARLRAMGRAMRNGSHRLRRSARGAAPAPRRRGRGGHTTHMLTGAGVLVTLYSLFKAPVGGDTTIGRLKAKDYAGALNQLGQRTIPGRQGASGASTAMYGTYGGLGVAVAEPTIRRLPLIRTANRFLRFKYAPRKHVVPF